MKSKLVEQEEKEEEFSLQMVCHIKEANAKDLWYLDTGYSNHMCGDLEAFSKLNDSFSDTVKFGDNSLIAVEGKGKVRIQS